MGVLRDHTRTLIGSILFSAIGGYWSNMHYYIRVYRKHSFIRFEYSAAISPRNPPLTVIKMMNITITLFHINLYANKSYLIDVDPPPPRLYRHPKFKILENALLIVLDVPLTPKSHKVKNIDYCKTFCIFFSPQIHELR